MSYVLLFLCVIVCLFFLSPFYKKMLSVVKDMDAEFSAGVKKESGFKNGAEGNFFIAKFYVMLLPLACHGIASFLLYLVASKLFL
ncbi:hypothetical protein [Pseudoalteromonas luteoviolacea]|uniref:Uncharacterized protein n=1 Tax=Pseudoalteromonas luteoviolacea H33 TaxID=1365251 RepID=A0A166ZMM4_9GAMM|nr:hypothetical protein [Pseudoalteromonas luteoviolacea]KZN44471.1 hypothetical protein N476_05605 [Pseudoalteromonas luteoviolacea H33]KZN78488.1 hypothetical protein N477_08795 [Pseudoalteromonas luteoviolacea H33-S]MBQ4878036.1 hypothetical protein [Pseudoalteromonas luteoviolacea]MBQ4907110.1 hypothetical protein [Pseudoalteromonas luteoviolacea]